MTALLEHFHEAVTTPEDVDKLKKLILQLAMQGKLVEQDSNSEPASELFSKIENEKNRLIQEKQIKKAKFKLIMEEETPYKLPIGWIWSRLGVAYDVRDGTHDTPKYVENGFPLVTSKNISKGKITLDDVKYISKEDHLKISLRSNVEKGDILFAMIGSIGNPVIVDVEPNFSIKNVALFKYYCKELSNPEFLYYYLLYAQELMKQQSSGAVQSFVSLTFLRDFLIPLPPISEQRKIVIAIEKLFKTCEELTDKLIIKQTKSSLLNKSVFTKLQNHSNPEQMNDLRFVIENMEHLCNDKESIAQLRNSILSLAVQGKLVEQDANEEPASLLVARIKEGKERLVAEKKIKKEKPLPPITSEEIPYELPNGWEWFRLSEITTKITDGTHHSPPNSQQGDFLYITAKNIKTDGVQLNNITYVEASVHNEIYGRCNPEYGDVLYIKDGATTGLATTNNLTEPFSMLSSVALLKTTNEINNRYFVYWLNSPVAREMYLSKVSGSAITRLTLTKIKNFIIPIPPLQEQKRIVELLDLLIEICNSLEVKLQETMQRREKILNLSIRN